MSQFHRFTQQARIVVRFVRMAPRFWAEARWADVEAQFSKQEAPYTTSGVEVDELLVDLGLEDLDLE